MFTPVMRDIWRWAVPDPEDHWLMVGHLIEGVDGVILVDPPMHPDLPRWLHRLGGARAIILTTHDHTRGARYLADVFRCPVYVPHQASEASIARAGIQDPIAYDETSMLPGNLRAIRCRVTLPMWQQEPPYLDEMMLIRQPNVLIAGDVVMADDRGRLQGCPEGFNDPADIKKVRASIATFTAAVPPETDTLLVAHGMDIVNDLRNQIQQRLKSLDIEVSGLGSV